MTWFEELFGFAEDLPSVRSNFTVRECSNHIKLECAANRRSFNAGRFSLVNVDSFAALRQTPSATPGTLHVIRGQGNSGSNTNICSVLESQSLPEFNGATFQAASNFNCLEFCGAGDAARQGVTRYIHDHTQGPYCALGAGAALVYRNYFVRHSNGAVGQIEKEIELLANTPLAPYVKSGYPLLNWESLAKIADANWDDLSQFYVGLHENCEVTTRLVPGLGIQVTGIPKDQIVHHVYAAAFNFAGSVPLNKQTRLIGEKLLCAEYQATVMAAWEMSRLYPGRAGSNRLVLTALGGGVFANPREMIVAAVASCTDMIRESGLQVYFVCFDERSFVSSMEAGLAAVMQNLGGHVVADKSEL
jgi:hypothetical protein